MTAKAALCKALLAGEVLNVKNVFNMIGLTNCAREISRMIEAPFGVNVSRTAMEGKSKYGQRVCWVNYRLNASEHNREGLLKMYDYVKEQEGNAPPKTNAEQKQHDAISQTMRIVNQLNIFGERV